MSINGKALLINAGFVAALFAASNTAASRNAPVPSLEQSELAVASAVVIPVQAKHLVTLADLETIKGGYQIAVSPDGKMLAYSLFEGDLWLVATQPGSEPIRIATEAPPFAAPPTWSPDGSKIVYALRRSGSLQLWVYEVASKHARQVTNFNGGIDPVELSPFGSSLAWSPDSSQVMFPSRVSSGTANSAAQNQPPDAPLVLNTKTPLEWTIHGLFAHGISSYALPLVRKTSQLFILDIRTKKIRQFTHDEAGYFSPSWSPDGKRIACLSTEGRNTQGFQGFPNVYTIDIDTGQKSALTTELHDRWSPRWSPDGKYIAYGDGKQLGWHDVMILAVDEGKAFDLTENLQGRIADFSWASDSESVFITHEMGTGRTVTRLNLKGSALGSTPGDGYLFPISVSPSGTMAWVRENGSTSGVVEVLLAGEEKAHIVSDINPQTKLWELGEQEVIRWTNSHGDDREGILIKPVHYQPGHKYPVIVDCYPGLPNGFYSGAMGANQAWASMGYVVFIPRPRPPHVWFDYSKQERERVKGPRGWDVAVDDVLSGVDELSRRGIIDPDRMGLSGFSNGAGVVNYLVTRTGRFKCAVSVAGVKPDWINPLFLELGEGGEATPTFAGGITPWSDPMGYVELSAIFYLDKVTTPMLLADGDQDIGFLLGTIEMYNGLRFLNKEVTLLRYPNQEHGFKGAAMKDFWERQNAFFDRYLHPEKPPHRS